MSTLNKEIFALHEFRLINEHVSYLVSATDKTWFYVLILQPGNIYIYDTKAELEGAIALRGVDVRGPHEAISIYDPDRDYSNTPFTEYHRTRREHDNYK